MIRISITNCHLKIETCNFPIENFQISIHIVSSSKTPKIKLAINIKKENIISAGRVIDMDKLVSKDFYNIIKNKVFIKPIGIHFWTTYLDIQDFQNITDLYEFIF